MHLDGNGRINLAPGDRIPSFKTPSRANPGFTFDSVAGRWLVLGCLGSLTAPEVSASLRAMIAETRLFDDTHASLFLMSTDPQDEVAGHVPDRLPGLRVLWDFDLSVSHKLGLLGGAAPAHDSFRPCWIVMDPGLTIRAVFPVTQTAEEVPPILDMLSRVPPPARYLGFPVPPPVLILPDVFEPAFCAHLIDLYHRNGAEVSGFMRDIDG